MLPARIVILSLGLRTHRNSKPRHIAGHRTRHPSRGRREPSLAPRHSFSQGSSRGERNIHGNLAGGLHSVHPPHAMCQSGRGHSKTRSVLRSSLVPPGFGVRQSPLHFTRISVALRLSFRLGPNVPAPHHCRRPVRGALHLLRPAERSDPTPPLYLPRIQGPNLTSRPSTGPRRVTPATLSGTVPAPGHR
jgi:hypothetical protein